MADAKPAYKLYLFKGKQYLKIDPTTMQIEGGPSSVGNWNGLAAALNGGAAIDSIDAAVHLPTGTSRSSDSVMFFKADKYCIYDTRKDAVTVSGKIADLLHNLPTDNAHADFTSDVDAAMVDGSSNSHLFEDGHNAHAPVDSLNFNGLNEVPPAPVDNKEHATSYAFTAPAGASLTVLVLNNLSAQSNVTVTVDGTATPALQVPAQRVWYNIYASNSGKLSIAISDDQGTPMLLSTGSTQLGHGTYLYIGAEKERAGKYVDTIVMISWPSKVV